MLTLTLTLLALATGPVAAKGPRPFEHDMSGLFLSSDGSNYEAIRIVWVNEHTPGAEAGLQLDDEIVSIDGARAPALTLDQARDRLRTPGAHRLEIRREARILKLGLQARRLI